MPTDPENFKNAVEGLERLVARLKASPCPEHHSIAVCATWELLGASKTIEKVVSWMDKQPEE